MTTSTDTQPLATYVQGLADDALILSHRCAQWLTRAPELEEDVALANIGLDLIGQARALLPYVGVLDGTGRTEDDLAYQRDEREFLNCQLVELPNGDFAVSMARLLLFATHQCEVFTRLRDSSDATLSAVAAKSLKEASYHRDHATQWVLRLGDGTKLSHARMQAGLETIWPYVAELFESDERIATLARTGVVVDPADLAKPVLDHVTDIVDRATLSVPTTAVRHVGGRRGVHTEHLGYLLAEMQHLARSHPGATW